MTRLERFEVWELARERKQATLALTIDGRYCDPERGGLDFFGPVTDDVCREFSDLLKRLVEEGRI